MSKALVLTIAALVATPALAITPTWSLNASLTASDGLNNTPVTVTNTTPQPINSIFISMDDAYQASYGNLGWATQSNYSKLGIIKAKVSATASVDSPYNNEQTATAQADLKVGERNYITFGSIGTGKKALVQLTSLADVTLSKSSYNLYDVGTIVTNSNFSYSTSFSLFQNFAAMNSRDPVAKASRTWTVCDNFRVCSGSSFLQDGTRMTRTNFWVDSDDVLLIDTKVWLAAQVSVSRDRVLGLDLPGVSASLTNDFSNSGYTMVDMLTTGATYSSAGEGFYPSAMPFGAVPEPASWAMMIVGFGLVGATRRHRDQRGWPHHVTA